MENSSEFYQSHLDRVSRSFALCIRQLPEPLRDWVALSYLLCRIVDTVEDSEWSDVSDQLAVFKIFDSSLTSADQVLPLASWTSGFPASLTEGEKQLIGDASRLIGDLHKFPDSVKSVIGDLVLSMSQGMQHFCSRRQSGKLRLDTLSEVNQYCFFVAGIVGELLAKLVAKVEPSFDLSQESLLRAHHFGLFLQKVNLLKDQVVDEKVGRHLIPSRQLVEDSAAENAAQAIEFLLKVPKSQPEFRRFCAWSLFLGIEALQVARASVMRRAVLKVSRLEMQKIFERVEVSLLDDEGLRTIYFDLISKLGWPTPKTDVQVSTDLPSWLTQLYQGLLDQRSLRALGVAWQN